MTAASWRTAGGLPFLMEMMLILHQGDGTILQASHSFKEVTGYGRGPMMEKKAEYELPAAGEGESWGSWGEGEEDVKCTRLEDYVDEEDRSLVRVFLANLGKRRTGKGDDEASRTSQLHDAPVEVDEDGCDPRQPVVHRQPRHAAAAVRGMDLGDESGSSSSTRDVEASGGLSPRAAISAAASTGTNDDAQDGRPGGGRGTQQGSRQCEEERLQCRLVTSGGSRLWMAWTGRQRGGMLLLSGVLVPQGRRHSLASEDGQRLARALAAAAAAAAAGLASTGTPLKSPRLPGPTSLSSSVDLNRRGPDHKWERRGSPTGAIPGSDPTATRGSHIHRTTALAGHQRDHPTVATPESANLGEVTTESVPGLDGLRDSGQSEDGQTGLVDYTETKQAEQQALIDVLAELFPGVMIARIALPGFTYSFANSAFCMRYGELKRHDRSPGNTKVIGRPVEAVRGKDAAAILKPQAETCVATCRQVTFDIRVPAPPPLPPYMFNSETDQEEQMQATLIPDIDPGTGEVRGLFEVIQSLAKGERRQAAEELEYQAHITQTITQNAASCLFMMDHKGFPTFMNTAAERVTGYTFDEIKDKPLHYAVHWKRPDNTFYPMEECPIDNSSVELIPAQGVEEVFVRKDGTLFPVICAVAPLSKGGRTVGAVIEFRDVTEERKREDERLSALREAEEHQRKRAAEAEAFRIKQERFIDTVCHELRNPLNGIYGNITLLQDELESVREYMNHADWPEKNKTLEALEQMHICLESMTTCARHQKVITDDVLHLSKLEANKIELNRVIFNPMDVIYSAASMFMSQIQAKKLVLRVKEPVALSDSDPDEKSMLAVRGDPDRFMQVVVNLISNAIKFTHDGGIKIFVYYAHRDHKTTEIKVEIADTGIGMSKDEQARIFDRFSQASHKTYREYGGSGLGLSITKGLVKLMGGAVRVESEKGNGSVFQFNIVCGYVTPEQLRQHLTHKEKLKQSQTRKSLERKQELGKVTRPRRILVTEDNSINKRVIMRFLERRGHYCEAADNGEEALDIFLEAVGKGRPFDLAFMDIEMPILDGVSATRLIREREKALGIAPIPIIGLSGNSRPQQIEEALEGGMSDYITKPYEQDVIYAKIDHWTAKMQGDKSAEGSDDEDEVHLPRVERDDEEEAEMRVRPDDEEKTINVDNGKKKEKERMDE